LDSLSRRLPQQAAQVLRISLGSGPLAHLEAYTDWVYNGRFQHLFGQLTYLEQPVHGFHSTRYGAPLDG
jgi:hypothetical protein